MKKKKWLLGMVVLAGLGGPAGSVFADETQVPVEGVIEEVQTEASADGLINPLSASTVTDFSVEQVRKIQDYQKKYKEIRSKEAFDDKFDINPIIGPEQYTTGTFKTSTLENATDYINLLRESAGLTPVTVSQARVSIAQHAAVGIASLRVIDHNIGTKYTKPEGMTDSFWQEASNGARLSNLARSVRSPFYGEAIPTLNEYSDLYMFDYGNGNQSVGHRRIVLNPWYQTIGFGFAELDVPERREVEYSAALYAQGDGSYTVPDDSIVTWPTESVFPIQDMKKYNYNLRWSASFNSNGYDFDRNNLKVTLKNNKSGQEWHFSDTQKDGEYTVVANSWGYDTVVFAPNEINYAEGDEFTVKVEGLSGKKDSYEYTTRLYDLNKEYKVPLEDFKFEESFIKMQQGEVRNLNLSYLPEDAEYTGKMIWSSSNANLVSVSQDGVLTAKAATGSSVTITAKTEDGKLSKTIKASVATVQPAATREDAPEINPGFPAADSQSTRIFVNQTGWVKFKADEAAMYSLAGGLNGNNVVNQKSEINFYNEWENRSLGYYSAHRRTSNSSSVSSKAPVYYGAGEYVYLKLSTNMDGEPFYFVLQRTTKDAQPIYTTQLTIPYKCKPLLNPGNSVSFSYKVDSYTTKPNDVQYFSDDEKIAEVVSDGANRFKIIGKAPGKTTIRVKEMSGSNQEEFVEVEVFSLGQTQETAVEVAPNFGMGFGMGTIYANQSGWLKFKAPETAKYKVQDLWSQDTATSSHRIETNFYDDAQWRGYYFADCAKGGSSASTGGNLPLTYEAGTYIYVHLANRKAGAPYYVSFNYSK
ncbi:hypothetical protein [Enterococcus sp. LJL51]|uniref:hypothetical protein n=1 Tax=Enterococcus sp. LJL51 TaxID=3416656 RepID=UPI003CE8A099